MTGALAAALAILPARGAAQEGVLRRADVAIYYWPAQERLAAALLPAALAFTGLPPDILQRGDTVHVYIAPDEARFDSLTGGRAPEWGAGVAMPQQGIIVLPGYVSARTGTHELSSVLRHELAHVALQRHLRNALVPRWFTEGYAVWTAGQFDDDAGWQLRLAFASGAAPPLDSLTLDWPLLATEARLAYLLSASAMVYLYSLGPPDAFVRFLDVWAQSQSYEHALRTVYIVSVPQFERLWRAHVKRRYGWLHVLAQSAFVWLVLSLIVLVFFLIRRRRDRDKLERLRAHELPDEPAFWAVDTAETPPSEGEDEGSRA